MDVSVSTSTPESSSVTETDEFSTSFRTENWMERMPAIIITTTEQTPSTESDGERFARRKPRGPARGVIGSVMDWAARRTNSQLGVPPSRSDLSASGTTPEPPTENARSLSVQQNSSLTQSSPSTFDNEIPSGDMNAPYEFPYESPESSSVNDSDTYVASSSVVTQSVPVDSENEVDRHSPWDFPIEPKRGNENAENKVTTRSPKNEQPTDKSVTGKPTTPSMPLYLPGEVVNGQCRCQIPEDHYFS